LLNFLISLLSSVSLPALLLFHFCQRLLADDDRIAWPITGEQKIKAKEAELNQPPRSRDCGFSR